MICLHKLRGTRCWFASGLALFVLAFAVMSQPRAEAQSPGEIITLVGGGSGCPNETDPNTGDGCPARDAILYGAGPVAVDANGSVSFGDAYYDTIRAVAPGGTVNTIAGGGQCGLEEPTPSACPNVLYTVQALAVRPDKNELYVAGTGDHWYCWHWECWHDDYVSQVTGGMTEAGAGGCKYAMGSSFGPAPDNLYEAPWNLCNPSSIAFDTGGDLYIAETGNNRIREIPASGEGYYTVAGIPGFRNSAGYSGDGGLAIAALLNSPGVVTVDRFGNLFIGDNGNGVIREVSGSTHIINTIVGGGSGCSNQTDPIGDGCPARQAILGSFGDMVLNSWGDLFIADSEHCVVRKVDATTGIISVAIGQYGQCGFSGDGGLAKYAVLSQSLDLAIDPADNLYIGDGGNSVIREVFAEQPPASVVSLAVSPSTAGYGREIDLKATVKGNLNGPTPTGAVLFFVDGTELGGGPLDLNGQATYSAQGVDVGDHSFIVIYEGSDQYTGNISPSIRVDVNPAVLTVKTSSARAIYGQPYPSFSYVVAGLKYGQTASVLRGMPAMTTTAQPGAGVGTYPISMDLSGVWAPNYALVAGPPAQLTVLPATLQVKALGNSVKQGAPIPAFSYALSGLTNGDTAAVVFGMPAITTTAVQGSPAGTYPIMVKVSGMSAANYNIVAGPNANLVIKP